MNRTYPIKGLLHVRWFLRRQAAAHDLPRLRDEALEAHVDALQPVASPVPTLPMRLPQAGLKGEP